MSRFAGRAGVKTGGDGFWSGTAVGASLGLVYAPCAGPILAGVITVSASQPFSSGRLAVALSYGIGSAVVLYFLMLGGRRVMAPLARRGIGLQIAMGAVMVVVAPGDARRLRHQVPEQDRQRPAELPGQPLGGDRGHVEHPRRARRRARRRGRRLRGGRQRGGPSPHGGGGNGGDAGGGSGKPSGLPVLGTRPAVRRHPGVVQHPRRRAAAAELAARPRRPRRLLDLQLHQLHPHAALPDRLGQALPQGRADDRRRPLARVPVRERRRQRGEAIERNGIEYPVVQDNDLATFTAYGTEYWPAEYFIDADGKVRYVHFGEGEYEEKEQVIRELLAEAGRRVGGGESGADGIEASAGVTHAGELPRLAARRPLRQRPDRLRRRRTSASPPAPPPDQLAYSGRWRVGPKSATAEGGALSSTSAPAASTSCSARPGTAAACGCCSTASRSPTACRRRRAERLGRRSTASASTTWSTCPRSNSAACAWCPKRG